MADNNPIVIIDDDTDDQELMVIVLKELEVNHEIQLFDNCDAAFQYLSDKRVNPFIIFSDVNIPGTNGLELRDKILANDTLRLKCIPYIFLSTANDNNLISKVYSKAAQAFFIKPSTVQEWRRFFKTTIGYWECAKTPVK